MVGKCRACGRETQAFLIREDGEYYWYCGECRDAIILETKLKKIAGFK